MNEFKLLKDCSYPSTEKRTNGEKAMNLEFSILTAITLHARHDSTLKDVLKEAWVTALKKETDVIVYCGKQKYVIVDAPNNRFSVWLDSVLKKEKKR